MVAFAVVGDDEVDLVEVDFLLEVFDEVEAVGGPDGVDEDVFFFLYEVGVLAGAIADGIVVAVEGFEFPVDIADPVYIVFYVFFHIKLIC